MVAFIDEHRETFGVEPICAVLPIAPSLYFELKARERAPDRRPARVRRDEQPGEHIRRVWHDNRAVYGVRTMWNRLKRERVAVARCTVVKTEEIQRRGPWKGLEDVEFATLEWVAWYNHRRLLVPLGYVPPAEFEQAYYDRQAARDAVAVLTYRGLRKPGAVHTST